MFNNIKLIPLSIMLIISSNIYAIDVEDKITNKSQDSFEDSIDKYQVSFKKDSDDQKDILEKSIDKYQNLDHDSYNYNYTSITNKCGVYDPYESFNRKMFAFNSVLDAFLLQPFAKTYYYTTNQYIRNRIGSSLNNFYEPLSTTNYILQGKTGNALKSFWRFAINTTLGFGGIFDIASKMGLKVETQRFSDTLGHYGVGPGPYIIIPFVGGYNGRSVTDLFAYNSFLHPMSYFLSENNPLMFYYNNVDFIHTRQELLPFTNYIKNSVDPYIVVRDSILNEQEARMDYPKNYVCPH